MVVARSFFRCLSCGHVTPYRAGRHGIVAHNDRVHEGRGRFEQAEPAPGHAVLKRRYSDDWEDVDLTNADIHVVPAGMFQADNAGRLTLLISWPLFDHAGTFLHGEWRSQRTAENRRLELRKIGRAGQ